MKSIEVVMLPVTDREKAKDFYQKLGFKLIIETPSDHGETWTQMGLPGSEATISLGKFHAIICETDDIAQELEDIKAKGLDVGKIDDTPWGKFAWVKDPDGNGLCLHQK